MIIELPVAPSANALDFIARPTPQLRAAVNQHQAALGQSEFAGLMHEIRSVFGKYTDKLLEFKSGADRGSALHQLMDRELKAAAQTPIACQKGCSGCCHYEVEIMQDEAEILKDVVLDGFALDWARLRTQSARERKDVEWNRFWSADNRCVFLGQDNACQIYEHRPSTCRKHLVVSPPAACTTKGTPIAPVQVLLAEILLSAALSLEGATFASLSKMLLAALEADALAKSRAVRAALSSRLLPGPVRAVREPAQVRPRDLNARRPKRSGTELQD